MNVFLPILLCGQWQTSWGKLLPHPAVAENHEKAAHNAKIAKEEVEVEDEAVPEGLRYDHTNKTEDGIFRVFADDDQGGASTHGDNIEKEEEVGQTPWY